MTICHDIYQVTVFRVLSCSGVFNLVSIVYVVANAVSEVSCKVESVNASVESETTSCFRVSIAYDSTVFSSDLVVFATVDVLQFK